MPPPPPRPEPSSDKPELYKCYRGRVSGIMDFGCFVELLGFRSKAEGMVHSSNLTKARYVQSLLPWAPHSFIPAFFLLHLVQLRFL